MLGIDTAIYACAVIGECQWETRIAYSDGRLAWMPKWKELSKLKLKLLFNVAPRLLQAIAT